MIYIWPYKLGSASAKALAQQLLCKRISGDKRVRSYSTIINWGNASHPEITNQRSLRVLNSPEAVARARNKATTLSILKQAGVSIPEFTTDSRVAAGWRNNEETVVYARHQLEAHSGRGIEIVKADSSLPRAPLYTLGIMKAHEYRVHVGSGRIIDFAKKRRRDSSECNPYVKNFDNGWVFCRDGVALPPQVIVQALQAVQSLGLDFGAVDILYREREGKAYVLEVNTAPGLEGTTLQRYLTYFRSEVE